MPPCSVASLLSRTTSGELFISTPRVIPRTHGCRSSCEKPFPMSARRSIWPSIPVRASIKKSLIRSRVSARSQGGRVSKAPAEWHRRALHRLLPSGSARPCDRLELVPPKAAHDGVRSSLPQVRSARTLADFLNGPNHTVQLRGCGAMDKSRESAQPLPPA